MKLSNAKYLALLGVFCAVLPCFAAEWYITHWSGGNKEEKNKRFTEAVNSAKDGDVLILQNNITVNADAELKLKPNERNTTKRLTVTSKEGECFSIFNKGESYGVKIGTGTTLVLSNLTYDCAGMPQIEDVFLLAEQRTSGQPVSRMILENGATIKDAVLKTYYNKENAVIHIKRGAVFTMRPGSAILNCKNESSPGKGGAICCDFGTFIMTGGTIAGCISKGNGGAVHTDGTRLEEASGYNVNERGDIYISGGYITNNTCASGKMGGGIYLGNTGPLLHITGTAVISNNFSGAIADDVSTYELKEQYVNRLKLVDYHDSHPSGFTYEGQLFTGWVGVRYPDVSVSQETEAQNKPFGAVWEYFNGQQDEARNFYWNGDNSYRGKIEGNSLIWSKHVIHELPKDGQKVAELIASEETPIYMELSSDYKMEQSAVVPENMELILDLKGFNLECDFHISNETARVTIFDSSTNKSGTVTGHRDSEYPNAFCLQGGSYATLPKPEWVASNCVVIGNYCEHHPYMVASKVWDAEHERTVTDLTMVSLEAADSEVRVGRNEDGTLNVGKITFSTGDWKFMAYTNEEYRVQVLAVPAVSNETSIVEVGERVVIFDSKAKDGSQGYGNEDEFEWRNADLSYGLIKLIHITLRVQGTTVVTNNEEYAYFQFPEAIFRATQRKTGGKLSIKVVEELLASLGYNRAQGFSQDHVNTNLDTKQANGLRKWENIVTGTAENQLLLSTVENGSDGGVSLNVALTDANKQGRTDTGYTVKYDIRKSTANGWERVGEIMDEPRFSVPLLGSDNKSVGASGFYRITTLIIPEAFDLAVTNEIPSTNIIGVLEVASKLANTLAAVPWTALATDPSAQTASPVTVSEYVHTPHLGDGDSVQVADKGHIYRYWQWNGQNKAWEGAKTITRDAVVPETAASAHSLERNSAVWVTRDKPEEKPFFLIGQYSSEKQTLKIEAGTEDNPVCTLVPNPCLTAIKVNVYNWGDAPHEKDLIRIPNGDKAPIALRWDSSKKEWGRYVKRPDGRGSVWNNAAEIPAGTGVWYMRCGGEFEIKLPASAPVTE